MGATKQVGDDGLQTTTNVAAIDSTRQTGDDDFHAAAARKEEANVDTNDVDYQAGWDTDEPINKDAQAGIQNIEATTMVWNKKALIAAYVWIWVIYFVDSLQQGTTGALTPYVTSSYLQHSLTPTTSIMSSIIGGVSRLTIAKIIDVIGRPTGYLLSVVFLTLGLILMAANNGVEMYAAAQVFYWVGYDGLMFCLTVFIADTSHLRNRGLMFAYSQTPYIITTWISGYVATDFLNGPGWRWGFGAFCIITPVMLSPLWILFIHYLRIARKQGILPERPKSGRNILQSLYYYCREFDAIGILLVTAGLALFLLSFNLYPNQAEQWKSPLIICFIIFGGLLLIAFAVYEKWFAPVTFIPYNLLLDRTVMGSCILAATNFISFYIWNSYFSSFLQVVNGLTVTQATYVGNTYNMGSCFWGVIVGLAIRYTGRFKPFALFFGVPLMILGAGLMIKFRQPDVNIGYIVMCQIFIAFAGGTCVITQEVAVMAAAEHQHIAVVIAMQYMFSSIGGAIGSTVSSAIWQNEFPKSLAKHLPEESQGNLTSIYGNLVTQLSYPEGSPTRIAIQNAYGEAQRYMLIAATCVLILSLGSVAVWKDLKIKNVKQVKGVVV
uniref:Major facilitator superfamily (MFS) profile domain-containing protein n=1 Tax=Bionectria ochroleuca TaxID=29856 RepID=A0A8H7K9X7_BIOOC